MSRVERAEKQETLAEIVAEMRGMGNYQQYSGDHAHALADRIEAAAARQEREEKAVLDFCDVFTLVYPPNDGDCPAVLAGAFELLKDAMGIETVSASAVEGETK